MCTRVTCQVSPITCQVSRVMCHVSGVTCQVSGVMCQVSHVSFFLGQSGEASRWRVCYQRGLPRLVLKQLYYHDISFHPK